MKSGSDFSTSQGSVAADQSASSCGPAQSTATWNSKAISVPLPPVQVAEQRDLRTVVNNLAVDVQYEFGHRGLRVLAVIAFLRPDMPGKSFRAEAAHARDPGVMNLIQLLQRLLCGRRVFPGGIVGRQPAEMGSDTRGETADDDVRQPPGDGGHRLRVIRWHRVVHGELSSANRDRSGALAPAAESPAAGHRLPEVL